MSCRSAPWSFQLGPKLQLKANQGRLISKRVEAATELAWSAQNEKAGFGCKLPVGLRSEVWTFSISKSFDRTKATAASPYFRSASTSWTWWAYWSNRRESSDLRRLTKSKPPNYSSSPPSAVCISREMLRYSLEVAWVTPCWRVWMTAAGWWSSAEAPSSCELAAEWALTAFWQGVVPAMSFVCPSQV